MMNRQLQEMYQRNQAQLVQRLTMLTERNHVLEQLVKEGLELIDPWAVPDNGLMEWTKHAKALLEQEVK